MGKSEHQVAVPLVEAIGHINIHLHAASPDHHSMHGDVVSLAQTLLHEVGIGRLVRCSECTGLC